jgi:predicted nucleic acid-binding protein
MIVVDSNVLAYLYMPGEHTAAAEALLELRIRDRVQVTG